MYCKANCSAAYRLWAQAGGLTSSSWWENWQWARADDQLIQRQTTKCRLPPEPLLWMTASLNYARFSKFTNWLYKNKQTKKPDSFLLPCISVSVIVNAYHFIPQETEAGGSCKFKVSSGYRTSSLGSLHLVTRCCFKKKKKKFFSTVHYFQRNLSSSERVFNSSIVMRFPQFQLCSVFWF